jgi:ornithine cyclodeaminase
MTRRSRRASMESSEMVQYVGIREITCLLRDIGPETFLSGLVSYLEEDFRRWNAFEKSARLASHSPCGVIELMPASDGTMYGFKYVNGHPANTAAGLLTVTAFGMLADVATGYPVFLSEMTVATALRTAAASALAARYLARSDCRTMALIGLGAQAEFQALAFKAVLGIERLRIFDTDPAATAKFRRNLSGVDIAISEANSVADAVRGADVVTTATASKSRETILTPEMVSPGMHLNAIGGDCPGKTELHPDILRASRVFVEFLAQSRIEGEIQQLGPDAAATELWRVIAGHEPGRRDVADVTVFDSVGFAIEDFSTLRYLRDLATQTGLCRDLDLVPELADPKDLFGIIARSPGDVHTHVGTHLAAEVA